MSHHSTIVDPHTDPCSGQVFPLQLTSSGCGRRPAEPTCLPTSTIEYCSLFAGNRLLLTAPSFPNQERFVSTPGVQNYLEQAHSC